MTDPRWSANEITAKFSQMQSIQAAMHSVVAKLTQRVSALEEQNEVLHARIDWLEQETEEQE